MTDLFERENFKRLSSHPGTNSTLKKKLSIINKLKQISSENIEDFIDLLSNENMKKFDSEIANAIVQVASTVSLNTIFVLKKLVQVIYLYSFDSIFLNRLERNLNKNILEGFGIGCLILEIQFLKKRMENPGKVADLDTEILALLKSYKSQKYIVNILGIIFYSPFFYSSSSEKFDIPFLEKLKSILNDIYNKKIISGEDKNEVEFFNETSKKYGLSLVIENLVVKREVAVEVNSDEFILYETFHETNRKDLKICKKIAGSKTEELQEFFGRNKNKFARIEAMAEIDGFNVKKLIACCNTPIFSQVVARIIAKYFYLKFEGEEEGKEKGKLIKIIQGCKVSAKLELICELIKYKVLRVDIIKPILNKAVGDRKYSVISRILISLGRFMFSLNTTVEFVSELLERLQKTNPIGIDRMLLKNALGYIFQTERFVSVDEFGEFLIDKMMEEDDKEPNSLILDILLLKYKAFNSNKLPAVLIIKFQKFYMVDIYIETIKSNCSNLEVVYNYFEIICEVYKFYKKINLDEIIDTFKDISIKTKLMLIYLEICDPLKTEYLNYINSNFNQLDFLTKSLYFTFCRKLDLKFEPSTSTSEDPFDYEMSNLINDI